MAAISLENCELEVKRKDDGSWHPCRISLSDDNLDVIVQFESCGDKDIISEEKDALARLRYRSVPVGKGGCSEIGEGECVLAVLEGQGASLFFDAVVMEPRRVKHSKRANCKCLFQIKWLNPEMEKNILSVSSSLIRKLSKKSITSHSVIDAFLNSLNPAASANGSPPNSLLDETIWGIVEKIEETSKCTEKSTEWAGDNFLRAKRGKLSGVALKTVTKGPNNSRRPTRNQAKQEVKKDVDKPSEDKPFVSPLAACAALASYIHELSPNHETLFSQLEKEVPAASILVKSDTSNTSAVSNPPKRSRPLSSIRSSGKSQSSDSQVSSTRPRRSAQVSNLSSGGLSSPPITEHTTIPLPVVDRELSGRTSKSRTTRSALQEQPIDSTVEVQELSKEKHDSLRNTKRPRRSVATSKPTENSQAKESEDNLTSETRSAKVSNLSNGGLSSPSITEHKTIPLPVADRELSGRTRKSRTNRSALHEQPIDSTAEVQELSKEKHDSLRNTNRPRRSVAMSRPTENSQAKESVQELSKEKHDSLRNTNRPRRSVAMSRPTENSQAKESEDNLTTETRSAQVSDLSSGGLSSPPITEHKTIPLPVVVRELSGRTSKSRTTRSALQEQPIHSTAEVQELSKEKNDSLRNTKRLRRSVATSKPTENSQTKESVDNLTPETRSAQVSYLSNGGLSSPPITEHKTIPLPVADRELSGRMRKSRTTRSALQEKPIDSTAEVQELSKEKHDSLRNTKRLRRSVATSKPTENSQAKESEDNLTIETNVVADVKLNAATSRGKRSKESEDNLTIETNVVAGVKLNAATSRGKRLKESEDNLTTETNVVADVKLNTATSRGKRTKESEDNLTTEATVVAVMKLNAATSRAKRSSSREKIDPSEVEQGSSKKRSTRVTRAGKEVNDSSVQQELGKITETILNPSVENDATPEKRSKKKLTSSLTVNEEDRGEVIQIADSLAVASKKPEKRSSARLRIC